jgi:hypothetical protein
MDWEKIKLGLLSAVGGAILLAVVGFNYGGWVTTGTAEAMAKEIAASAVAERLGSICVAQFNGDSEKGQKLKEMKEKESWDKARYVEKQSWAIRINPIVGLPMRAPGSLRQKRNKPAAQLPVNVLTTTELGAIGQTLPMWKREKVQNCYGR